MPSLWNLAGRVIGLFIPHKKEPERLHWVASALRPIGAESEANRPSISSDPPAVLASQQVTSAGSSVSQIVQTAAGSIARPRGLSELYLHAVSTAVPDSRFRIPMPSTAQHKGAMRWVPAGEPICIQDRIIKRGMVYVGTKADVSEPSLLDPTLRVKQGEAAPLPYWPSYAAMEPSSRLRYLDWLCTGAVAPIEIGYVFVYFYGFERRLLLEGGSGSPEASQLLAEVERLLSVYGNNNSFRRYASALLEFCRSSTIEDVDLTAPIPCTGSLTYEVPFRLRLALGGLARSGQKLPSGWALQWSLCDPMVGTRTPVQRCPKEFARAFESVYRARHADGFFLPQNKTMLKIGYQAASAGLSGVRIELSGGNFPDILAVTGPRKKLQAVVDEATEMIEPYSRFVGRNESKKDTLEAWLALPPGLWPTQVQDQLNLLRSTSIASLESLTLRELFHHFGYDETAPPAMVAAFVQAMEDVAVGFEPDVLAGARRPCADDHIVLFPLTESQPPDRMANAYKMASLDVALSACFALADGNACEREQQLVDSRIASLSHLSPDLKCRLRAQYRLQVRKPASFAALKTKVRELSEERRHELALNLSAMASADGMVSPEEVRFMEQLYRSLQLDPKLAYAHLYGGDTKAAAGSTAGKVSAMPGRSALILDKERIERLQKETAQVSALLSSVFLEEESHPIDPSERMNPEPPEVLSPATSQLLPGLEKTTSEFLLLLLSRVQWTRRELEDAASDMQIMLDGALEKINEASLDAFDEMLLEGEDPIFVQQNLLEMPQR